MTASPDMSRISLEWLLAEELIVHALVLSTLWLGRADVLRSLSLVFRNSFSCNGRPGLAGIIKTVDNRIR